MNDMFAKRVRTMHGEKGKKWLDSLPEKIKTCEDTWQIKVGNPFSLSYNYVAPAITSRGTHAVLKMGFPGDKEFLSEIAALNVFDGKGAVKLLQEDTDNAVIVEEQVIPGTLLSTLSSDEEATRIAAGVAEKLWRDVPESERFIRLEDWFGGFERYKKSFGASGILPKKLFEKGRMLFENLLQTTSEEKLLHGDFHHGNILFSDKNGWIVIDPKGLVGDPIYDLAVFLYNPIPTFLQRDDAKDIVLKRIEIFSEELGFDKKRLQQWGIAQAVLSAIWSIEDGEDPQYAIRFAKTLEEIAI